MTLLTKAFPLLEWSLRLCIHIVSVLLEKIDRNSEKFAQRLHFVDKHDTIFSSCHTRDSIQPITSVRPFP